MPDNYCAGFMIDHETEDDMDETMKSIEKRLTVIGCIHPAWKMRIIGIVGIPELWDFGWECTKCGKVLRGRNPFKDESNLEDQ